MGAQEAVCLDREVQVVAAASGGDGAAHHRRKREVGRRGHPRYTARSRAPASLIQLAIELRRAGQFGQREPIVPHVPRVLRDAAVVGDQAGIEVGATVRLEPGVLLTHKGLSQHRLVVDGGLAARLGQRADPLRGDGAPLPIDLDLVQAAGAADPALDGDAHPARAHGLEGEHCAALDRCASHTLVGFGPVSVRGLRCVLGGRVDRERGRGAVGVPAGVITGEGDAVDPVGVAQIHLGP